MSTSMKISSSHSYETFLFEGESNITKESIRATKFNNLAAYIPLLSTFTSVIDLGQKVFLWIKGEEVAKTSAYYEHIQEKSKVRCVVLLVPVLGNVALALYDGLNAAMGKYYARQAEKTKKDPALFHNIADLDFMKENQKKRIEYWEKGAAKGNHDCLIKLGQFHSNAKDSAVIEMGCAYLEKAARVGNPKALLELSEFYEGSEGERLANLARSIRGLAE